MPGRTTGRHFSERKDNADGNSYVPRHHARGTWGTPMGPAHLARASPAALGREADATVGGSAMTKLWETGIVSDASAWFNLDNPSSCALPSTVPACHFSKQNLFIVLIFVPKSSILEVGGSVFMPRNSWRVRCSPHINPWKPPARVACGEPEMQCGSQQTSLGYPMRGNCTGESRQIK